MLGIEVASQSLVLADENYGIAMKEDIQAADRESAIVNYFGDEHRRSKAATSGSSIHFSDCLRYAPSCNAIAFR